MSRGKSLLPAFIIVVALCAATMWRYSPTVEVPPTIKTWLKNSIEEVKESWKRARAKVEDSDEATNETLEEQSLRLAATTDANEERVAAGFHSVDDIDSTLPPRKKKENAIKSTATSMDEKPKAAAAEKKVSDSPFLEPAAKALKEFRQKMAEFEAVKDNLDMAEMRKQMKALHFLREKVELLNRKHREWKRSHKSRSN